MKTHKRENLDPKTPFRCGRMPVQLYYVRKPSGVHGPPKRRKGTLMGSLTWDGVDCRRCLEHKP